MKLPFFKLVLVFGLLLCSEGKVFSQEKTTLFKDCLWLKNETQNIYSSSNEELELKKYLNFNSFVDFSKEKIVKKYKNVVYKNSSLFIVYKSTSNEENILLSLERGSFKANLSNQKIVCDKEVILNKGDSKKGILLSYLYNKNSLTGRKNGNLILEDLLFEDKEFINQLAELIFIPRYVNDREKVIIESYLSLKYGISLNEGQNYYNSSGDKIWDIEKNEGYNFNITGIGKDEYTGLIQKQAKNSLEDGISIGLNQIMKRNNENESFINNKVFLLWGNNGESVVLEKNSEGTQKNIKRVWKINAISDSVTKLKTQIKIDKKLMQIETRFDVTDKELFWLAIDSLSQSVFNYNNAKYIKASINDENEIVFNNIDFNFNKSTSYLFTIVKAKEKDLNSNYVFPRDLQKLNYVENNLNDQLLIYPNPINANEKFNLQFNLKNSSDVIIQISDINGKVIKTKKLSQIKNYTHIDSIMVSGTYMIIISIDGNIQTNKLIVK